MRSLLLSLGTVLCCTSLTAQVSMDQMIQERMARQGQADGMKIEDDNDPFVPNTFIGSFRMEMHRFKNGTEDTNGVTNMLYWSSADKTLNQMESSRMKGRTMKTMTDLKGKWTYTLMSDEKGKRTAMKSHKKKITYKEEADGNGKKPEITVTNETKVIEGHTCTKVVAKSEDGSWTGWVAKDIAIPFADMMRSLGGGRQNDAQRWKDLPGFPLEYEWVDKDGTDKMVVYMKDLKVGPVDESVFSLDGYEVMEMPSFGH